MGKTKKFDKIIDVAAGVITWHDEAQIRFGKAARRGYGHVVDGAAAIVTAHDNLQAKVDRIVLIIQYHAANSIHKNRRLLAEKKKTILGHAAGVVLIAIAMIALFNHATGFEYSYNGKVLGYVKNQEDVTKILDLVSTELSKEYGSRIEINKDSDITFEKIVTLDKEIDDIDTVLKRLTYMSDMEAEAYAIYIDGSYFVACESKNAAQAALTAIQQEYLEEDENTQYEDIGFKENVEIREITTKLAYISSVKQATDKILEGGSKELVYEVKAGDTFSEIFAEFDTTFDELKENNPDLDIDELYPGDEIIINQATSALTVLTVEKSTYPETVKYKTEYVDDDSMYEGDTEVLQKGSNGKRVVTARIIRENGQIVERKVLESETITKSVKRIVARGTKEVPKTAPTGTLIMPLSGGYTLSSTFGWRWGRMHEGIDLAAATGTTIRAADGGTVTYAGWYSGYGLFIEIDHGNGKHTRYGHCSAIDVSVGEAVYQGQKIGEVGNTGNSTGSHCHFEVTINGTAVDPMGYL